MFKEGCVTVMVSDMKKSIRFYTDTLGLKLRADFGGDWAEVEAPGLIIGLHPGEGKLPDPKTKPDGRFSIGFTVTNLEQAMTALGERDVKFAPQIKESDVVRLAFFNDPDGNPLYLSQVKF